MKINELSKAILLLGLIMIVVYFPMTILDHSYNISFNSSKNPALDLTRDFGCKKDCMGPFNFTIDPGADGDQTWPVTELAAKLYLKGILPLWNPYLAAGTPLAADTVNFVFSPMMIFYLLPNFLWDIPILISIWLAGIFTYLLLKVWGLNFISSVTGSLLFMLSGSFTWYSTHDSILVVMFIPLILFSIEKIIQRKKIEYIILGSVSIAFSILGAHLESIVLVLLLCLLYSIFRVSYEVLTKLSKRENLVQTQINEIIIKQDKQKIIFKIFITIVAGLALSSFFILPAAEYINEGTLGHGKVGLDASPPFTIATTFMPYFLGPIHVYASPPSGFMVSWNVLGGYVASSSLVLCLIGISFSNNLWQSKLHKRLAQFFFACSIFFILKSIGFPIVNLIGSLPILDHIIFPRYDGFLWTLGFAISAAFGIEVLIQRKIRVKNIIIVTLISSFVILSMAILIVPYFTWEHLAGYYIIFQILQALFFTLMTFFLILSIQRDRKSINVLFFLIFLELSLYIPMGLPPIWQFYRSIIVIISTIVLCVASFVPIKSHNSIKNTNVKLKIFIIIVSLSILGQLLVYVDSPQGLPLRHNAFDTTSVTEFLKNNIGYSRMISFDSAFRPNFPASYEIQTLGIISAQNVNTSNSFVHNSLDPYIVRTVFDYIPSWRSVDAPSFLTTYLTNEKYYDFLGVKYLVTFNTNPNNLENPLPGNNFNTIGSHTNIVTQNFVAPVENFTTISIQLGTYGQLNHGELILTVDSIPFKEKYHRISKIKAEEVVNGGFNDFKFKQISGALEKNMSISLSYPEQDKNNSLAVFFHDKTSLNPPMDYYFNSLKGKISVDGKPIDGVMAFQISSNNKFPLVFNDGNVKVYENNNAYPRSFLINKFQISDSYENAQNIIKDPNFDLRHEIVLEKNPPIKQANLLNSSNLNDSTTKIVSYTANKVTINVNATGDSLLVLTDTYYPGWQAHIDGKESNIYRADGLVRAVFVPAGNHIIEFSYMPQSFMIGMMISFVTMGILLGLVIYLKKMKNKINDAK